MLNISDTFIGCLKTKKIRQRIYLRKTHEAFYIVSLCLYLHELAFSLSILLGFVSSEEVYSREEGEIQ